MNLKNTIAENYENVEPRKVMALHKKKDKRTDDLLFLLKELLPKQEQWITRLKYKIEYDIYLRTYTFIKEKKIKLSPEYITEFAFNLAELKTEKYFESSGEALSALINVHYNETRCNEEYKIPVIHFEKEIDSIGVHNSGANIKIIGNTRMNIGNKMTAGKIIVDGNCQSLGYSLIGGKIEIQGDVKLFAGTKMQGGIIHICGSRNNFIGDTAYGMRGGKIIIDGDGGNNIGTELSNGEIHIKGDIYKNCFKRMSGGTVIIEGKCKNTIAENMSGGTIYLSHTARVSTSKNGGEIYCKGKRFTFHTRQEFQQAKMEERFIVKEREFRKKENHRN